MSYKYVKRCCEECFADEYVVDFIHDNCEIGSCDYCGKNNVHTIEVGKLGEHFRECIEKGYELITDGTGAIYDSDDDVFYDCDWRITDGMSLKDILVDYECVFNEEVLDTTLLEDLFEESGPSLREMQQGVEDEYYDVNANLYVLKGELYKIDDCHLHNRWIDFCDEVRDGELGTHDSFLDEFSSEIDRYVSEILPGEMFYRVRSGFVGKGSFEKEMGPAPIKCCLDGGRMNKPGTTYLYLASDVDTCKNECRINGECTCAEYESLVPLKIVDLSRVVLNHVSIFDPCYLHEDRWLNYFLLCFRERISKPIESDRTLYYPTQYIADYFKRQGYCGIAYKSSVSQGTSYVFFCGPNEESDSSETRKVSEWFSIRPFEAK